MDYGESLEVFKSCSLGAKASCSLRQQMLERRASSGRDDVDSLLELPQVSAWRCSLPKGFPHFEINHILSGVLGVALGVAALSLSLRDGKALHLLSPWTSTQGDSSEVEYTVAGLQNVGNNCFLNVVLQALATCGSFHSFVRNNIDADDKDIAEREEDFPLSVALFLLLEELGVVRKERTVLSPRKVMLAMSSYASDFSLARQQDAAEALLFLLTSLEEETSQNYLPNFGSLKDVCSSSCTVSSPEMCRTEKSECRRWQHQLFGQFDGIIGSLLTCGSCSSQLSLDFEFFRCLNISPVLDGNGDLNGCSLEECLEHFTAREGLESYRCSRCSHMKALKYLSLRPEENKGKIEQISKCMGLDSCDCRRLFAQEGLPWPTGSSRASKKLTIARCPKIFCMHLHRASMDLSGEIIKIQGHVSFPLFLDLFPFSAAATGMKPASSFYGHHHHLPAIEHKTLPYLDHLMESSAISHETVSNDLPLSSSYGEGTACPDSTLKSMFRLTSVVEHYGVPGSGHYAVYRRVGVDGGQLGQWFYVSDDRVLPVSEADVLGAEASLLFYERVNALTS
ncbi:ubiquitin-specific protease 27 isoform X2 [Wolffia australiana]